MIAVEFGFQKLLKQFNTKGKKSLTAQQMAVMTRKYGNDSMKHDAIIDDTTERLSLYDETTDSKRAKGFGFFSWVSGLFSDDILFSFNGTQIKGKADHQVRGGAVPLFNGVVLDLKPASMTGRSENGKQIVSPSKETDKYKPKNITPAKLVVAPWNITSINEHPIADFEMKAPVNGEVEEFGATIDKPISYLLGRDVMLEADGAKIDRNHMQLKNPRAERELNKVKEKIEYDTVEISEKGIRLGTEIKVEKISDTKSATEQGDGKKKKERSYIDRNEWAFVYNGDEKGASFNLKTGEGSVETEGVKLSGNIFEKTGKLQVGQDKSKDKEEEDAIKKAVKQYFKDVLKKSDDALAKLGFAEEALMLFFKTGKLPDNKYESNEEEEKSGIGLSVMYPIIPFLDFKATLQPDWAYGFNIGMQIENGERPTLTVTQDDKGNIHVSSKDIQKNIILSGDLRGKIGAKLVLALAAGLGYMFDVNAGLFASGAAKGVLEGGDKNIFGSATLKIPITVGDQGMTLDKQNPELLVFNAGIGLEGKVGAQAGIGSTLFGWEKELWSCTFATWEPMKLMGTVKLKKQKGAISDKGSWKREETSFKFNLFKKTIEGTKKYGIKMSKPPKSIDLAMKGSEVTRDKIEKLHEKLSEIEERIKSSQGGQFGTEKSEAYQDLLEQLDGIYNYFEYLRNKGISSFNQMDLEVKQYENDPKYKESLDAADKKIQKHQLRVTNMENWAKPFGEGEKKGAYAYYKKLGAKHETKQRRQKQAREETARQHVATKANLIAYETARINTLGKKGEKRIKDLENKIIKMAKMPEEKKREMSREIVDKYKDDKELLVYAGRFAGRELIERYEKGRQVEYRKRHLDRYRKLRTWLKNPSVPDTDESDSLEKSSVTDMNKQSGPKAPLTPDESKSSGLGFVFIPELNKPNGMAAPSVADWNKPNRKFAEYYHKELGAKRFFRKEVLLKYHQNAEEILAYEKERLVSKADSYVKRIDDLKKRKSEYDDELREEDRDRVTKEAREAYEKAKGGLGKALQWNINAAKAASKEEVLIYEREAAAKKEERLPKNDALSKKVSEALNKGERLKNKFNGTDMYKMTGIYQKWVDKNFTNTEAGIKKLQEVIPLEALRVFEYNHGEKIKAAYKRHYNLKVNSTLRDDLIKAQKELQAKTYKELLPQELLIDFSETELAQMKHAPLVEKIVEVTSFADSEYMEHRQRGKSLEKLGEGVKKLNDSDRDTELMEGKAEYFKKYLLDESGKDLNEEGKLLLKHVRNNTLLTIELFGAVMEQVVEGYSDAHEIRYKKLRTFMGLEELKNGETVSEEAEKAEARKSSKTDKQVWDYYRSLGAGNEFADDYAEKKKKSGFSIDEMLRYEEYEARAHSGRNGIKALIQKKSMKIKEDALSKDGADEQIKEFERLRKEGNHYDRYLKLEEAVKNKKSNAEIVKLYQDMGGGDGYVDALTGRDMLILDLVTPQEILNYENTWSGKEGEVHGTRLEKIKKFDANLSKEEVYDQYRKMVLEESVLTNAADKISSGAVLIDFDESLIAKNAITPEIILEYEKRCQKELLGKHLDRLSSLQKPDVTDENAWEIYKNDEGGGKRFARVKSSQISLEEAVLGEKADYQNIIKYENSRIQYYEAAKKEIEGAMDKIKEEQKKMEAKIQQAEDDMTRVKGILDSYASSQPYKDPGEFKQFMEDTTGSAIQEKMDQAAVIEEISEAEEEKLNQLRENQMKLIFDEETSLLVDNVF